MTSGTAAKVAPAASRHQEQEARCSARCSQLSFAARTTSIPVLAAIAAIAASRGDP
jgi:hypothetical protein